MYILWNKISRRKLSPTLATAHYTCPDNTIGLVAQCKLSGYFLKIGLAKPRAFSVNNQQWQINAKYGNLLRY